MFVLQAKARVTDILSPRSAGFKKSASLDPFKGGEDILRSPIFEAIAGIYAISPRVHDYVFLVLHALTADRPNDNGDCFPTSELLRFDEPRRAQVYRTFQNGPFHEDHKAQDRTAALGFIPDCTWMIEGKKNWVDCLVAVDAAKRPDVADDYESGRVTDCSMGCLAAEVQCDGCHKVARSEHELCMCLKSHKMPYGPRFEICRGVTFSELSKVGDGADPDAVLRAFLGKAAAIRPMPRAQPVRAATSTPMIDRLGMSAETQYEIGTYYEQNMPRMPRGMHELGERLFG